MAYDVSIAQDEEDAGTPSTLEPATANGSKRHEFRVGWRPDFFTQQSLKPPGAVAFGEVRLSGRDLEPGRTYQVSIAVESGAAPAMRLRLQFKTAAREELTILETPLSRGAGDGAFTAAFRLPEFVGSLWLKVVAGKAAENVRLGAYGLIAPVSPPINPAWVRADQDQENHRPVRLPEEAPFKRARGLAPQVRIAFIGSEGLARELSWEADVVTFPVRSWRSRLERHRPDLVLVETAWRAGHQCWSDALKGGEGASELAALAAWARESGVPTSLWAREDQINIRHFAWLLDHFDRVYAVDETIAATLSDSQERPVRILRPGVQLKECNPLRGPSLAAEPDERRAAPVIEGLWDLAADPSLASRSDLAAAMHVAEGRWAYSASRLGDVGAFRHASLGSLDPGQRRALQRHALFHVQLQKSFEPDWRRREQSLRHAACGSTTLLASAGPPADDIYERWVQRVPHAEAALKAAADWLSRPEALHRHQVRRFREVVSGHDLADRLAEILTDAGVTFPARAAPRINVLLPTRRPQLVERAIAWFRRQSYANAEMSVILHDDSASPADFAHLLRGGDNLRFLQLSSARSLGECLNFAAMQADGDYVAKVDDDDFYGDRYLSDFELYTRFADIELCGKAAAFFHLEQHNGTFWMQDRMRRAWTSPPSAESNIVAGGTLIAKRSLFREMGFPEDRRGGSDTLFVRRWLNAGRSLITLDAMNYALFRSAEPGFHTWNVDSAILAQRGRRLDGDPAELASA